VTRVQRPCGVLDSASAARRGAAFGSVLAVLVAGAACGPPPQAADAPQTRPVHVETATVQTRQVEARLRAVGTVRASASAKIQPQVDAVIAEIAFREGARVEAGELLVRLEDRKARAKLALARAALDSSRARRVVAEQRLARHEKLIAENLVSQETFDSIAAEARAAAADEREREAAVALAERELEDYALRAPFGGTVGARLVDIGNYVERGTTIVVLLDTDPVTVRLGVPDRHAGQIDVGTPVDVVSTGSGPPMAGKVDFIDPRVDAATRMLGVRARVANPSARLRDGQFVEASLLLETRGAQPVVPEEAILSSEGENWIFVVEQSRALRRGIRLGQRMPPWVEVVSGVSAGETVVTAGQHRLVDGARVRLSGQAGDGD